MRNNATWWAAGAALAAGLLAPSPTAAATIICVTPPAIATCPNHSIAVALASAGPGDIIKLAPGTYYENDVTIPIGLDGLQIQGSSKTSTILDIGPNSALGVASTGVGLVINARNVAIKNMTIRNGVEGILSGGPGALVTGMNFVGQDTASALFASYGARFTLNEVHGAAIGVWASGFGAVVKSNLITSASTGVSVGGDQSQVQFNRIYNALVGINATADGVVVKSNDLKYQQTAIFTQGAFPTIQSNRVLGAAIGISSACTNCFGGSISFNAVTDATIQGIVVSSDNPGLSVQGNTILRAGVGIAVSNPAGTGDRTVFVTSNKATDIGNIFAGHCYWLVGDGNVVYKNQATRCSGSGYRVQGSNNTLDSNLATATFENGFTIDGNGAPYAGNYLTLNKASGNAGEGIAIIGNAALTMVEFNTATSNRKDFCDTFGNSTHVVGNSFADPGGPVLCDIVH
jgi:hypothetical protein